MIHIGLVFLQQVGCKMNKKGTSLVELIISLALISVVLIFMVKMLLDINNSINNSNFAKNNQITRAEIIRLIENDIKDKRIEKITDESTSSVLTIKIKFKDISNPSIIMATKSAVDNPSVLTYTDSAGSTRKWTFAEGANIYIDLVRTYYSPSSLDIYTMNLAIEVHTINDFNTVGKNNNMDDIVISYVGKKSDLTSAIPECLGNKC